MKVFINPGHDVYVDSGAVNPVDGTREADIVAKAGELLEPLLQAVGIETKLEQSDDLEGVCVRSNDWGADLFVSLHCNASFEHNARGAETWYKSYKGSKVANYIQNQIVKSLDIKDRGIKFTDKLYVLNATNAVAVLVEMAFIDNNDDLALLQNELETIVRAIARGITDAQQSGYFNF